METILDKQTINDEREQAYIRYGHDQHETVEAYIEGLIDGAKCYKLPD